MYDEVLFRLLGTAAISDVLATVPFERTEVENMAKKYWPKMQLFASNGQGVLPRMCFDTLTKGKAQTIFLTEKGHQIDVNQELVNAAGIIQDARTDEDERVVEIQSDNEEPVQPETVQSEPVRARKRKRSVHEDHEDLQSKEREQGNSMVRHLGPKRVPLDEYDGERRKRQVPATSDASVASGTHLGSKGTDSAT